MPGETLENSKKIKVSDWLLCISSVTASIVLPQKSCGSKIPVLYPRVSPGDQPLAKEPEDSESEIEKDGEPKFS